MTKQEKAVIENILVNTEDCESIPLALLPHKIKILRVMLQSLLVTEEKPVDDKHMFPRG